MRITLYPGQYEDDETGLYYNLWRYYDPGIGRYISADPIKFAGGDVNWYGYAKDNPVNIIDVSGLTACPCSCNTTQKDLKDKLNNYINSIIQTYGGDLVTIFNQLIPKTSIYPNLTAIENWFYENHKGELTGVYDDPRRAAKAPCMRLCGQCVGTDKVGHFFEEGALYREVLLMMGDEKFATGLGEWAEGLVPTDPAVLEWLLREKMDITWSGGTLYDVSLYGIFGNFGDGTLSANGLPVGMADLEANLAGLSFWEELAKLGTSFTFDICDYVTDKWDEHVNPNVPPDPKPTPTPTPVP